MREDGRLNILNCYVASTQRTAQQPRVTVKYVLVLLIFFSLIYVVDYFGFFNYLLC